MINPDLPIGVEASLLLFATTALGLWLIGWIVWDRVIVAIKNLKGINND